MEALPDSGDGVGLQSGDDGIVVAADFGKDHRTLGGIGKLRGMLSYDHRPFRQRQVGLARTVAQPDGEGNVLADGLAVHPQTASDLAQGGRPPASE